MNLTKMRQKTKRQKTKMTKLNKKLSLEKPSPSGIVEETTSMKPSDS